MDASGVGPRVDVERLAKVLEARIGAQDMSWRAAAGEIGVSPALLSRLRNRQQPDLPSYVKMVDWLGMSADDFLRKGAATNSPSLGGAKVEPELTSEVSALLRARHDLGDEDKKYLEDIFAATLRLVRTRRSTES